MRPVTIASFCIPLACVALGFCAWLFPAPAAQSQRRIPSPGDTNTITIAPIPDDAPPKGSSFIEGIVYDARTKEPLSGITVFTQNMSVDSYGETTTNDRGYYRLPGLRADVSREIDSGYQISFSGPAHSRRVMDGVLVPFNGLRQNVGLARSAVVRGTVRDIEGRPIAKARLNFYDSGGDQQLLGEQITADENGEFRLEKLDVHLVSGAARYGVEISHPKYSVLEKQILVRARYSLQDEVVVNYVLQPRAVVKGRITSKGKPLADAYISPSMSDGSIAPDDWEEATFGVLSRSSGVNGNYSLSLSAPQTYLLEIGSEGMLSAQAKVQVKPGQTVTINRDLAPFPYGSIAGRISDFQGRPITGANIELWTPETSETLTAATTDKNGRYRVAKVAPRDDYRVVAYMPHSRLRTGPDKNPVRVRSYKTTLVNLHGDPVVPNARLLSPASNTTVKGAVIFKVKTADNYALDSAKLILDPADKEIHSVSISTVQGWREERAREKLLRAKIVFLKWNTREVANGWHRLHIDVYDLHGNAITIPLRVRVKNP